MVDGMMMEFRSPHNCLQADGRKGSAICMQLAPDDSDTPEDHQNFNLLRQPDSWRQNSAVAVVPPRTAHYQPIKTPSEDFLRLLLTPGIVEELEMLTVYY